MFHLTNAQILACRKKSIPASQIDFVKKCIEEKQYLTLTTSTYYQELFETFLIQLLKKSRRTDPDDTLSNKAHSLTRHFIKRKLDLLSSVHQPHIGMNPFDPHHHFNSIYVKQDDAAHLRLLLPDFNEIYEQLRTYPKPAKIHDEILSQGIIHDVQSFGYPPSKTTNSSNCKVLHNTRGYLRGGNIHSLRHSAKSVDYCGVEDDFNQHDVKKYLDMALEINAQIIRFHMGETVFPEQGKKNVAELLQYLKTRERELIGKTIRIGHGTHMGIDNMLACARNGYFIECCLSSNKETGIIEKRHHYPLAIMLLLDIKVVIGTDGGDIYYTDLNSEYGHAEKNLRHFHHKITLRSTEEVCLLNGDKLLLKHIKHLMTIAEDEDDMPVTYAHLASIKDIEEILNTRRLLNHMQELKQLVTEERKPKHAKKAKTDTPAKMRDDTFIDPQVGEEPKRLQAMLQILIDNIDTGNGKRWTNGHASHKLALLNKIENRILNESSWNTKLLNQYIKEIRGVCEIKRHAFHFWAKPDSAIEFEILLLNDPLIRSSMRSVSPSFSAKDFVG